MMMQVTIWKAIAALLLSVLPVSVKTNSGETIQGDLAQITATGLQIDVDGELKEFAFEDVTSLEPGDADDLTEPTLTVTLLGGSKIRAVEVQMTDDEMIIQPRRQDALRIPVREVKSVRFRPPSPKTDPQWLGIVSRESRGDTLVIRRPGDRLDAQQGIVVGIQDQRVGFDLDGDVVQAPVDRLEGIVFGGSRSVTEDADVRIRDVYGSDWAVMRIHPSRGDQPLQIQLTDSLMHQIPLHQIKAIRWSSGIMFLAQQPPASVVFEPFLSIGDNDSIQQQLFGPANDGGEDLMIYGGSRLEYRVDPQFQSFSGIVRRAPQVSDASALAVRILLDEKVVWEQTLDDAVPRGFEIPLNQARRLTLIVDHQGDGILGDIVRVERPRLLK